MTYGIYPFLDVWTLSTMYSVMVLGSDWFSAAVIRTIQKSKHPNISSLVAVAKG